MKKNDSSRNKEEEAEWQKMFQLYKKYMTGSQKKFEAFVKDGLTTNQIVQKYMEMEAGGDDMAIEGLQWVTTKKGVSGEFLAAFSAQVSLLTAI